MSSTSTSASVTYTIGNSASQILCTLDGAITPCDTSSADLTNLGVGAHVFVATASGVGGSGSASATFTVVAPAPAPAPPAPPPTSPAPAPAPAPARAPAPLTSILPTSVFPVSIPVAAPFGWTSLELSSHTLAKCTRRSCAAVLFSFALSAPAHIQLRLTRGGKSVASWTVSAPVGRSRYLLYARVHGHVLAPGAYLLTAQALAGTHSSTVFRAHLRVR